MDQLMRATAVAIAILASALPSLAQQARQAQQAKPLQGSITVAFALEGKTLDPAKYSGGPDRFYLSQIYETLIRPDPKMKSTNWLAESWSVSEVQGKPVIDVRLRKGVKFHNGYPLTAADLEFSFNRMRDPKVSRISYAQQSVEKFEVVDPFHFRLHFNKGDAEYIAENLTLWAMSRRYFEEVGEDEFGKNPIGTGPWKFVSRQIGTELKLEAFEEYWNKQHRPGVKNLTIKIIPEDTTRLAAFTTGAVDWIDVVPVQAIEQLKKMPGVKTVTMRAGTNVMLTLNTHMQNSPFRDRRVREAVARGIDWKAIIDKVLLGQGEQYAQIGPDDFGYDPTLKPYPYDARRASALLREAGYPTGFDIPCYNFGTQREPNIKEAHEAAFAYLAAIGIRCKTRALEYSAWLSMARRARAPGQPEMDGILAFTWGVGVPGDPSRPWAGHLHSYVEGTGYGQYSTANEPEMDALVKEQNATMDRAKRLALVKKIARLKHEQLVGGIPTYLSRVTFAWRGDKINYTPWPWMGNWREMLEIGVKQ